MGGTAHFMYTALTSINRLCMTLFALDIALRIFCCGFNNYFSLKRTSRIGIMRTIDAIVILIASVISWGLHEEAASFLTLMIIFRFWRIYHIMSGFYHYENLLIY